MHETKPSAERIVSEERRRLVGAARKIWTDKLIDLTRRNNLLFYRPLKLGTFELEPFDSGALAEILAGGSVLLTRLVPDRDLEGDTEAIGVDPTELSTEQLGASRRLTEIQRKAQENFEERGLETMYLAYGLASWKAPDGGRDADAAVLLVPVKFEGKERKRAVRRRGDLELNPALMYVLEHDYEVRGLSEALLALIPEDEGANGLQPYEGVFAALQSAAAHVQGFTINRRAVFGNFSFQKLAMVKDLEGWGEGMADSDLIAALAGDKGAQLGLGQQGLSDLAEVIDWEPPEQQFLVLDADSSQHTAIMSVLAGHSVVIAGPPGTGKSQTISNLIAALAGRGQRVLFVAEKRAALEMVKRRLVRVGLGDLILDLHGAVTKREMMAQFASVLDRIHATGVVDADALLENYARQRDRLRIVAEQLRRRLAPVGIDLETLHGRLLRLPTAARTLVRWRDTELDRFDSVVTREVSELLQEAGSQPALFLGTDPSPWSRAALDTPETTMAAIDLVRALTTQLLPALNRALLDVIDVSRVRPPATLAEAESLAALLRSANTTLERYRPSIFDADLAVLVTALRPASSSLFLRLLAPLRPSFRGARNRLNSLRSSPASPRQLLAEASSAIEALGAWRKISAESAKPVAVHAAAELARSLSAVREARDRLGGILQPGTLSGSLDEMSRQIAGLARDEQHAARVSRLRQVATRLRQLGVGALIDELRTAPGDPTLWPAVFDHGLLSSVRDRTFVASPELAVFSGRTHDDVVREFGKLDHRMLEMAVHRLQRAHAEHAIAAMNEFPDEQANVRREAYKKSRHKPLRELLVDAPNVLTALKPCWMASPLTVSQLMLGSRGTPFDVVVFDEASQVLPEDAVTALLRGRVAVVAGDRHQLPPTPFFVAGQDSDEDADGASATVGFESVLDAMRGFLPERGLEWHYRSEDERLIAFSNHEIYGARLVTFPGVGRGTAVSHVLVPQVLADGEELSSSAEVERVCELILEHATQRPDETLGVITMGVKHQRRIQARLDEVRGERPELDSFFDSEDHRERQEPFFVKNLERVQGDERDSIILSIGYGKDRAGKLVYRFGPLLYEGGERRLNVAITRAKRRMTVASSFSHEDMDDTKLNSRGMRLLKQYLRFAATNGTTIYEEAGAAIERNPFELDVEDALRARGIDVTPQYGVSRYRIDLVANHPKLPGRRMLAIECDGASYHSAPTVRDRDRLRQEHLERLGWTFVRIWSTDWFQRRDQEIERVVAAYEVALRAAGAKVPSIRREAAPGSPEPSAPRRRGPKPVVLTGLQIDSYDDSTLVAMVRWVESDGLLRTDEELVRETAHALGFQKVGTRIRMAIAEAVHWAHRSPASGT